ncbi:MAG: SDR family NAD(P)-dependent oxidoreductase, partial [Bryobacteraceae bacterium]
MNIENKVALITGGASGLGAATARMIVSAGGRVVIVDANEEAARAVAASLGEAAIAVAADVTEPEPVAAAITAATSKFGRLDIAVSCAGIGGAQRVLGKDGPASLEWFARIVQVNLIGTFNVARLAAQAMAGNEPDEGGERGVII